jgi:plasmid stability protein
MTLTIHLPEDQTLVLEARAKAEGLSAEQYVRRVLEQSLVPDWLRVSWASAMKNGASGLSMEDIDTEVGGAQSAPGSWTPARFMIRVVLDANITISVVISVQAFRREFSS